MKLSNFIISAILLASFIGCNSAEPTGGGTIDNSNYTVAGILIKDLPRNSVFNGVQVRRDGAVDQSLVAVINSTTLTYGNSTSAGESTFFATSTPASLFATGNHILSLTNSGSLNQGLTAKVLDTFSVTSIVPATGIWRPLDGVMQLSWTAVPNTDGYVMAVVKRSNIFTGTGYNDFASSTSGTVPAEAFYSNFPNNLDTGMYNIYIYSFNGVPNKAMADNLLPTPFPNQFTNNIFGTKFSGHYGTITISFMDSIHVVAN